MAEKIISMLFDNDSFVRTEAYVISEAGVSGDGVITGYGAVSGRLVYAAVYDSSVLGGAFGLVQANKIARTVALAKRNGAPFVFVIDSQGVKLNEGVSALSGYGVLASALANASGVIPLVADVDGICPGTMAALAGMCDFTVMNKEKGKLYMNSELVVSGVSGTFVEDKSYGGGEYNSASGGATVLSEDQASMYSKVRTLLQLLPDNNASGAPNFESNDDLNRYCGTLENKAVSASDIIKNIADNDAPVIEIREGYAKEVVCALGVMGGATVGFVASEIAEESYLTAAGCEKTASFVELCDSFNIPVVTLSGSCGFLASEKEEKLSLSESAARLMGAYSIAEVPKITVVTKQAYGGAYVAMGSKSLGCDYAAAWDVADVAALSPKAGVEIMYHDDIVSSVSPDATRAEKINEYKELYAGPGAAAAKGELDEIIKPGETRAFVISALMMLSGKSFFGV
jgi:acetyl-CoA carboxylase carboxyltransferase component